MLEKSIKQRNRVSLSVSLGLGLVLGLVLGLMPSSYIVMKSTVLSSHMCLVVSTRGALVLLVARHCALYCFFVI